MHVSEPSSSLSGLSTLPHLLPKTVQLLANDLGIDKALRISIALAGTSRLIPVGGQKRSEKPVQRLIDDLGCQDLAESLMRLHGGEVLYIPSCAVIERAQRDIRIHQTAENGLKAGKSMIRIVADLAKQNNLSDRRIWEILKKPAPLSEAN